MATVGDGNEQKKMQKTLELLNKAALRIQESRTQEEIFISAVEELKRFQFHVVFMLFNEEKTTGRIVHITAGESLKKLKDMKKPLSELEFPLRHVLYKNLIEKKEPFYVETLKDAIQIVPPSMYKISEKVANFLGIANKKAIAAPLIIQDESIGLLAVISDDISTDITPYVCAFANQISPALQNARLRQESQNRTDALAKKLEEQELLRALNTQLFLAQSRDEVLDAAIEGIHLLGKSFSNISMLSEEGTHCKIVRVKIDPQILKVVEKRGRTVIPKFTLLGYEVPVYEKDNIYSMFFENQIPLITSNIAVHRHSVMKAELSEFYSGFAPKKGILQRVAKATRRLLPYKSVMAFPLVVEKRAIGALSVTSEVVFSQEDFELMRTVGEMVSGALERVLHSEKLTDTYDELKAVQKINALMNVEASLEQILIQLCTSIKEIYHYKFVYPLLLDPSRKYLNFTYVSPPSKIGKILSKVFGLDLKKFKYPVAEGSFYYNHIIKEKKCIIVKGFEELADKIPVGTVKTALKNFSPIITRALFGSEIENSIMIAPLPYGDEVIGILLLGHKKSLTEEDFQQLKHFLDQVGIAIAKSHVEYRLRQSLEELRELDRMKSEFIDIASHELRTPLTTLKLYLEMMLLEQYGELSESLKERMRIMEEGVSRLEEIINQTLVASRLIKNKLELERKPLSLLETATEVIHRFQPLWKIKNQSIIVESPTHLSLVRGDKKALFTAMSNLVDNAIRYSSCNTEIVVKFTEHPEEVECAVIDQGRGIPPEHIEKIFDEFYIVPSETEYARMNGRTGLGLFIAEGIIKQHGGRIWVESTPGEGSIFHFAVPK